MDAYLDMVYTNIGLIIGILGIIVGAIIAVYFYLISKKENTHTITNEDSTLSTKELKHTTC